MRITIVVLALFFVVVAARTVQRSRRQAATAYALPDGIEFILNAPLSTNFRCEAAGYYADVDNNCQLFHVCDASTKPNGATEIRQYTFACGNQTIFNQLTLTCALPDDSIPCNLAPQFYRLNDRIGQPTQLFHTEEDLTDAAQYIPSRSPAKPARRA